MGRALKYLFRLVVLAALGLIAYAYLHDLPPPTEPVEVALPVPPGTGQPPATESQPTAAQPMAAEPQASDQPGEATGVMQE